MRRVPLSLFAVAVAVLASPVLSAQAAPEQAPAAQTTACKISCVAPFPTDAEADKVIKVVENITKALADRNYDQMMTYMDEGCTTYDANTKREVVGREAIISDVKLKIAEEEAKSKAPILSYSIDRPFAKVNGDTAVVCFILVKEVGGAHPQRFEAHCTDVFAKRGEEWKKLNFRGDVWKRSK